MKREIDAMLRAYAQQKRQQADAVERIASAFTEIAMADERFMRQIVEAVRPTYGSAEPSPRQPSEIMDSLAEHLRSLTPSEFDRMRKGH